jgi:hypothetical protein
MKQKLVRYGTEASGVFALEPEELAIELEHDDAEPQEDHAAGQLERLREAYRKQWDYWKDKS